MVIIIIIISPFLSFCKKSKGSINRNLKRLQCDDLVLFWFPTEWRSNVVESSPFGNPGLSQVRVHYNEVRNEKYSTIEKLDSFQLKTREIDNESNNWGINNIDKSNSGSGDGGWGVVKMVTTGVVGSRRTK